MYYITVKASPKYHQMTFEELLFGMNYAPPVVQNETNTRTYEVEYISDRFLNGFSVEPLIKMLEEFNAATENLRSQDRSKLYYHFCIPKKSGGLRPIDAPVPELMEALRTLKNMFELSFNAPRQGTTVQTSYYHTAAFAYIHGRSTIDAVKRHQSNESKWFAKLDFSNFFGTTTLEHTMKMLSLVFPFCEICKSDHGYEELRKAVELGFLNGVLPQGTPLSPTLTNIIMVPVDYRLSNRLRNTEYKKYIYTRYADDMLISSRFNFNVHDVENAVLETLKEFDAPYVLNKDKTRYGSICGSNWNLGVMLNKDNEITIGWRNKKRFEAMLSSYAMDRQNGIRWDAGDLMHMEGLRSYYRSIEQEAIDKIVEHLSRKFGYNIVAAIKQDLRPAG